MSITKIKERVDKLDYLVRHKMTGTPKELAQKLNISKRQLFNILNELKALNMHIVYNTEEENYYYANKGKIEFSFIKETPLTRNEMKEITGGIKFFSSFFRMHSHFTAE